MISTPRPRSGRLLVEDALRLHIHDLRGRFGFYGAHELTAPDGTVIRLRLDVAERYGWAHVEHWPAGAAWASSSYDLSLYAQDQHLGGMRWLLECPLSGVRTPVLYLPAGASRFASRQAHGLAFASQRLRAPARAAARARRIREDLGGSAEAPPVRPAGMWRSTFARRSAELARLAEIAGAG